MLIWNILDYLLPNSFQAHNFSSGICRNSNLRSTTSNNTFFYLLLKHTYLFLIFLPPCLMEGFFFNCYIFIFHTIETSHIDYCPIKHICYCYRVIKPHSWLRWVAYNSFHMGLNTTTTHWFLVSTMLSFNP